MNNTLIDVPPDEGIKEMCIPSPQNQHRLIRSLSKLQNNFHNWITFCIICIFN